MFYSFAHSRKLDSLMTKTFRLKKSTLYLGLSSALLFLVLNASLFWLNPPRNDEYDAGKLIGIVGCTPILIFMLSVSVYLVVAYKIERTVFDNGSIIIKSVFQNCQFGATDITQLKWRLFPSGGSIIIRGPHSKGRLDFGGFLDGDKLQIIRQIRELVPADKQQGWPEFCHRIALPARDRLPSILRENSSLQLVRMTRRRYDRFFILLLIICSVHALIWCFLLKTLKILVFLIFVVLFWALFRFSVPADGQLHAELRPSYKTRIGMILFWVCCLSPFTLLLVFWDINPRTIVGSMWVAFQSGMFGMLFLLTPSRAKSKKAIQEIHQRALAEWDEGERLINSPPRAPC